MRKSGGKRISAKLVGLTVGLAIGLWGVPAMAQGPCTATAGNAATLIRATILTPGEVLSPGEVLVDAEGIIACVGDSCGENDPAARRIDCPGAVLSPGFVNPHEHLAFGNVPPMPDNGIRYTHRNDWRKGMNGFASLETFVPATDPALIAWMELRHLLSGETAIIGGNMAPGGVRNLDFREGLEGLDTPRATYDVFPLDDTTGIQRVADCDYGPAADTANAASALHAYVIHLAEGVGEAARNEFRCLADAGYDTTPLPDGGGTAQDLLHGNVTVLHGVGLDHAMLAKLARRRVALVWSPRSNLALYGKTVDVADALDLGIPVALGTDWLYSGSMTMVREADCALSHAATSGRPLDGRTLWTMMTRNGAHAARMDGLIGQITPGAAADLILVAPPTKAGDPHMAVVTARPEQMMLVMRGGRVLSGDAKLVSGLDTEGCEALRIAGRSKRACLVGDVGVGYAALKARADAAGLWPAFFPGNPPVEPTCSTSPPAKSAPVARPDASS